MNAPRQVVIVGRDAAAWMTAVGLQRAFGRSGVNVHVVELPSTLWPVDVYSALPALGGLHRLLGINTAKVLDATYGIEVLGQRFANWARSRPPFLHGYDAHGAELNHVPFIQHWIKARQAGLKVELEDFSLAVAAAKQGRYLIHTETSENFSRAGAGFHFDAQGYTANLRHMALQLGVGHSHGAFRSVERDPVSGDIVSVVLAGGQTINGDFFVDASGAEALLIGGALGEPFKSWDQWLPCDRVLAASGPRLSPLPPFSQISAFNAGWFGLYPLRNRTAMVAVYNSRRLADAKALENIAILSGMRPDKDAFIARFSAGARRSPWRNNCVAIGGAAVALEPIDAVQLHVVHLGLAHLIDLFPTDRDSAPEAIEYNETMFGAAQGMRDFQAAHYKLNGRIDEPFWDEVRQTTSSEMLARKIDLFKARGQVAMADHDVFDADSWTSIFIGHGLTPQSYNPMADLVSEEEQIASFSKMLSFIAAEVKEMPSLETHLEFQTSGGGGMNF